MTNQEAFDRVWQWFVVEKHGPSLEDGQCRYRSSDGCKCAAGVLIPDDEYDPSMEGYGTQRLRRDHKLPPSLEEIEPNLLGELQGTHDIAVLRPNAGDFSSSVEQNLRELAENYSLRIPEAVNA